MVQDHDLVGSLKKSHEEITKLIGSFRAAVEASNRKAAKELLARINDATRSHFTFEENYLYPRMRRLMFELIEKLGSGQEAVRGFIKESRDVLGNGRSARDAFAAISQLLPAVSRYLEDCNDLAALADKFGAAEKGELAKKLKECCKKEVSR